MMSSGTPHFFPSVRPAQTNNDGERDTAVRTDLGGGIDSSWLWGSKDECDTALPVETGG